MCIHPILIKNKSRIYSGKVLANPELYDTTSQYIYVNCGVCSECLKMKQLYLIQRVQLEALDNYIYFLTFTYSDEMLPSVVINDIVHYYASIDDIQKMFKRVRKNYSLPSFKYIYVSEYGSKKHRPHFHMLLFFRKSDVGYKLYDPVNFQYKLFDLFKKEWRRNLGSTRKPIYKPLFNYKCISTPSGVKRNFDCHYVNPTLSNSQECDVAFYVSKYVLKYDSWFDKKRIALYKNLSHDDYIKYYSLLRPRVLYSKQFGVTPYSKEYIRNCIDNVSITHPLFINPLNGHLSPMSPYLFNKFGNLSDKYRFFYSAVNPDSICDSFHYNDLDSLHKRFKYKNDYYININKNLSSNNLDL